MLQCCKVKMLLPSFSNTIYKCLPKTSNFVNTDKPCRKNAKACEKTFSSYVARSKKFVAIFHKKVFLVKLSIP